VVFHNLQIRAAFYICKQILFMRNHMVIIILAYPQSHISRKTRLRKPLPNKVKCDRRIYSGGFEADPLQNVAHKLDYIGLKICNGFVSFGNGLLPKPFGLVSHGTRRPYALIIAFVIALFKTFGLGLGKGLQPFFFKGLAGVLLKLFGFCPGSVQHPSRLPAGTCHNAGGIICRILARFVVGQRSGTSVRPKIYCFKVYMAIYG
jgi:hypothetical protein